MSFAKYMATVGGHAEQNIAAYCKRPTSIDELCDSIYMTRSDLLRVVRNSGYLTRVGEKIWLKKAGKRPEALAGEGAKGIALDLMREHDFTKLGNKKMYDLFLEEAKSESIPPVGYETFTSYIRRYRKQYFQYWLELWGTA